MSWFKNFFDIICNNKNFAEVICNVKFEDNLQHVFNVQRDNFDNLRIKHIDLVKDFWYPFHGRDKTSRNNGRSGEDFMEKLLLPAIENKNFDIVIVNLNNVSGVSSSWLEGAFSYLVSKHGISVEVLREKLYITPEFEERSSWAYINTAQILQNFSKGGYR